jgi:hypothetical protein
MPWLDRREQKRLSEGENRGSTGRRLFLLNRSRCEVTGRSAENGEIGQQCLPRAGWRKKSERDNTTEDGAGQRDWESERARKATPFDSHRATVRHESTGQQMGRSVLRDGLRQSE